MRQRAGAPRWRAAESREAGFPPKQPAPDMLRARGGDPGLANECPWRPGGIGACGGEKRRGGVRISRSVEIYYSDELFYVKNNL